MAEKMIRDRLFTYFEEVPDTSTPDGKVLRERLASLGQVVDITYQVSVDRGEELNSFYTDEERAAIEDGTYTGIDAESVFAARGGVQPKSDVLPADGETGTFDAVDAEELGRRINDERLTIPQTLALLPDDPSDEQIQKLIDAENIATGNSPRAGVIDPLERELLED
jgi:hypothetical protein